MSGYIGTQPVPQATQTRDIFTCTASQTSFATGGYQAGYIDVFLNGVKLVDGTDFTATNGSDVVLTTGAASGDVLEVVAYTAFEAANVTGATDFTVTGSFTSRGIDDNATSTAMTLDSSGNLLVGKTSLGAATGVELASSGQIAVTRDGAVPAFLRRNNSDGSLIDFNKDGTVVGSIGALNGGLFIDGNPSAASRLAFGTSSIVYPETTGVADIGASGNRFKDLYLSGGVYLGGTGAANKLDDYEFGTFSPEITGWSGSYGRQDGVYTKIGNWVYCYGGVRTNGGTGSFTNDFPGIAGLPFTSGISVSAAMGFAHIISGAVGTPSTKTSLLPLDGPGSGNTSAFPNWVSVGGESTNFNKVYLSASSNVEYRFNIAYRTS